MSRAHELAKAGLQKIEAAVHAHESWHDSHMGVKFSVKIIGSHVRVVSDVAGEIYEIATCYVRKMDDGSWHCDRINWGV